MDQTFMKERPVLPLLLSMSIPMVLSMAVNSLYNIVDSYFVVKISEDAMTALSLIYPIQNFINALAIGFGVGINAVIAYYLGAGEQRKASLAATWGVVLNALHGVIMAAASLLFVPFFLEMFTDNEIVIELGINYATITFGFAVVITVCLSFEKIFQATGKMTVSMLAMLAGSIANILLDPLLIFGLGPFPAMGIRGAAWATVTGQVLNLTVYLAIYFVRPLPVKIRLRLLLEYEENPSERQEKQNVPARHGFRDSARGFGLTEKLSADKALIGKLYSVGIPATLNMALPSLLVSALNATLAVYSQTYVLVLGIYYKLQTFLYLPANGIIQGMRPLIGYNCGAGETHRVRKIYLLTLALTGAIMVLGTLLCLSVPAQLMGLFTTNGQTIQTGTVALRIISAGFVVSAVSVTSAGALEGLGQGMPSLMISLLRYVVIIIPVAFLLSRSLGAVGVWHSFWVAEFLTAVAAWFIYKRAGRP